MTTIIEYTKAMHAHALLHSLYLDHNSTSRSCGLAPQGFPIYGYKSQGGSTPSRAGGTLDSCNGHTHMVVIDGEEVPTQYHCEQRVASACAPQGLHVR